MVVNIVTVQSGWILQKIAERIVNEGKNQGYDFRLSHQSSDDVDCNVYIDIQNCFVQKSKTLDIGFFTHMDLDSIDTVNKNCLNLDYIIHMCSRYYEKFKSIFDENKMSVLFPAEVNTNFTQYKPKIGIFQRGKYEGKGFYFMLDLADNPIIENFRFKFVGKDWDAVVDKLKSKNIEVEYFTDEDYSSYPAQIHDVDYVLVPSLWEGGPMGILEALASGKEIISADVGFVGDFQVDHIFKPNDIDGLNDILENILKPIRRRRNSTEGLTYKSYVESLIQIINKIKMKKLNLGCGTEYLQGWVNVDSGNTLCDVKHDLEIFPWPFAESSVTEIRMHHVLEHISKENFIPFLREMYRVCCNGAVINIDSPHAGSDNFWTDPTHKLPLTTRTFDYFDSTKPLYVNGTIYNWNDIKITVQEAVKIPNEPNGPDIRFKLIINK